MDFYPVFTEEDVGFGGFVTENDVGKFREPNNYYYSEDDVCNVMGGVVRA